VNTLVLPASEVVTEPGLPPLHFLGADLTDDLPLYWLYAGMLLAGTVAVHLLVRSQLGSALTAAGDSPVAAAAAGIDIAALRRTAFATSAVLASLAGSGYASTCSPGWCARPTGGAGSTGTT